MTNNLMVTSVSELYNQIEEIVTKERNKVTYQINNTILETYFLIGKLIVENEQNGNIKAEYGKQILKELSKRLTKRFGSGFSVSNMQYMRRFYLVYNKCQPLSGKFKGVDQKQQPVAVILCENRKSQPLDDQFNKISKFQTVSGKFDEDEKFQPVVGKLENNDQKQQTLSGKLSWSHYCYLISIEDDDERSFYEQECIHSGWSKRELKRQIDSCLFQRLLLSNGKNNKEKVLELSRQGQTISKPDDILKEPYVFEFLGMKEDKPILESDLEKSLIQNLPSFLMELGKGFMYVGNQKRITLDNNTHYYVDLVFYNKILKSYVLIDLKMTDMKPEYVGQMNMYLNYFNNEVRDSDDNETIGIILCKGKNEITMEYALGGLSNRLFASTYTYYIPDKELLIKEVEKILKEIRMYQ